MQMTGDLCQCDSFLGGLSNRDRDTQLFSMLAAMVEDLVVKTDAEGYVQYASGAFGAMVEDAVLIAPHLADYACGTFAKRVRRYHDAVVTGASAPDHIEFPSEMLDGGWYRLSLQVLPSGQGAIGIVKTLEVDHGSRDPLTALPNRAAFTKRLSLVCQERARGAVIMLEIDGFRAITLRFGQEMGDSVITAFARFLRSVCEVDIAVARMEGERFAVLLPECELVEALAWAQDLVTTFAAISGELHTADTKLTVSAGVARLQPDCSTVMHRAELGVSVAKTAGGKRTECGDWLHGRDNPERIRLQPDLVAAR